jgi:type VI secretion system secreted protein VgrG
VRFHRSDSTEQADTITGWNGRRTLQSGSVARSAWDHTTASVTMASEDSKADQGDGGAALSSSLEDYLHEASLEGDDAEAFSARTKLRMQAREGWAKRFDGSGTVRTFAAGTWFTLQEHPIHDHDAAQDREFVLASVDVEAVNNLPKDLSEGLAGLLSKEKTGTVQKPGESYRNTFVCVRRGIPILPDEIAPPNPGILTATVSGPPGEVVHTDELGRIKVTFHFARPDDHPEAGATGTDADSAWIRQIETASSSGFGASFVPRVGDEVVVQFMGGDPDRPLIIGSLSNSASPPTAFAGISGLPGDKALTGIRSQMHGGFGGNQLVLDDTKGQLRTQLASDHADSALNLGFLVQPRSGGVGAVRGEGAELCSAASTAVRGDKGLLLSAESASSQMGRGVAMGNLNAALALSKTLGETAEKHGTDALEVKPQEELVKLLDDWEKGSATDPKGEGGQPVILASAPAGLALSSGKATTLQAGSNLDLVAMGQAQLSAGKRLLLLALESVSIFAHKLGMKLIAADGDMSIQAQNGKMESIAAKDLSLMSVDGMVTIDSAKGIMLRSGGGYILIKDGKIDFVCPEVQTFKSASQTFAASSSQDAATAALPKSGTRQAN